MDNVGVKVGDKQIAKERGNVPPANVRQVDYSSAHRVHNHYCDPAGATIDQPVHKKQNADEFVFEHPFGAEDLKPSRGYVAREQYLDSHENQHDQHRWYVGEQFLQAGQRHTLRFEVQYPLTIQLLGERLVLGNGYIDWEVTAPNAISHRK